MSPFNKKEKKQRIEAMSSKEKADMIKRLERERAKINAEIESILESYAKESGNRALLPKRKGTPIIDDYFTAYEE